VIRAANLTKVFGASTVAVDDVSFGVERGELFVVMGLSGSGKSTLLRMLNRLVEPTRGTVEIGGRDVTAMNAAELRDLRNRTLSMVFQHFALLPHRTVLENAAYGLRVRGEGAAARTERAARALEEVGLADWGGARPSELSGGMQQRVGLARALATDAEVMLMDEPFSALDPLIRRDMQALLLRLRREHGTTIVFITHDLNEAMRLGDRILLLRDGRAVQLGTRAEILSAPADPYVADFVADVDRTRVLTAADVMERAGAAPADSAATAPERPLLELIPLLARRAGPLPVVDGDGRLLGEVSPRRALEAIGGA